MGMEQGQYIDGDSGADFTYGYGAGGDSFAVDYASQYAPIDYAPYEPTSGLEPPSFEPIPESPLGGDLYGAYLDFWLDQGLDFMTAMEFAAQDAAGFSDQQVTSERGNLPDISPQPFYGLPYIPDPFLTPYTPTFPDLLTPLPPTVTPAIPFTVAPPPQVPMPTPTGSGPIPMAPGLPPACPTGSYHPFPIGHPDQNKCIPFPPAQVSKSPQPIPAGAAGGGASKSPTAQKPPQQQQCPTGQYRDPATGQCKPIPSGQPQQCPTGYYRASNGQCLPIPRCTTPGTVFDAARGLCVPQGQAISPLPSGEFDDLLSNLKELPWWIWLALGGLFLLSRDDDSGKKTTVTYRRAR